MATLLFALAFATIAASFCCSITEAALYSVPVAQVQALANEGSRAARALLYIRKDISKPIAAILVVNTLSNTLGPTLIGAIAVQAYGEDALVMVSVLFGISILYLGEIIPKVLGSHSALPVMMVAVYPLAFCVKILWPFIWLSKRISRGITTRSTAPTMSDEEFISLAAVGMKEGSLDSFEGSVISNVIGLDQLLVKDVLTPRASVFRLSESTPVGELERDIDQWTFSRTPIYSDDDPEQLSGYVLQRDILKALMRGRRDTVLTQIARPLNMVPEQMSVDKLLNQMFSKHEHICGVVNEHGGFSGVITLEDILEEVVGTEILDESDLLGQAPGEGIVKADKALRFRRNREKKLKALQDRFAASRRSNEQSVKYTESR